MNSAGISRDRIELALADQIDRQSPEREHGQRLIAPCEVAPQDGEVDLQDDETRDEQRNGDGQSLEDRPLVEAHEIGYDQPGPTRKAVSPEVIGAAITPSTASRPPSVPSQSRVIELTMIAALSLPDEAANSAVPSSVWKK